MPKEAKIVGGGSNFTIYNVPYNTLARYLLAEKCFPARNPRWLILQRGPSLVFASLPRPTEGTPASVLDGMCKKNFFSKFSKSFNSQKYRIKKNANFPSLSQKR